MTAEQFISISENFQLPVDKSTDNLITDNKYFKGLPLYKKVYENTTTYIAALGKDLPRTGINALVNIDNKWYSIPVIADLRILQSMADTYTRCSLLIAFCPDASTADKMQSLLTDLAASLGFNGELVKLQNAPTKRFPMSYTLKINKSKAFLPDFEVSRDIIAQFKASRTSSDTNNSN